jgi:hypothetical protein
MDMTDPVVWGSFLSVAVALVVFVFLVFKVNSLMKQDEESHKK